MKPNFSLEVREEVTYVQGGWCHYCDKGIVDFHHRISNSKVNRKLFPLLIQSVFNCVGLCRKCHTDEKWRYAISLNRAAMYEHALDQLNVVLPTVKKMADIIYRNYYSHNAAEEIYNLMKGEKK